MSSLPQTKDIKTTTGKTFKQQGNFKENANQDAFAKNQNETVEIYGIFNEKRRLGKINIHKTY